MQMAKELTTNLEAQGKKKISINILKTLPSNIFIRTLIDCYIEQNVNPDFLFYFKVNGNQYDFIITNIPEQYVVNRDLVGHAMSDSDCYKAYYMIPREGENCYE